MEELASHSFAVLADVHGNRWALQAVLEELRRAGITRILNLGDALYGPLDPAGTARILLELELVSVRGNEDRLILDAAAPASDTLRFVRAELEQEQLEWLASLPPSRLWQGAFLCHGTPESDSSYLLWDVEPRGARARTAEEVAEALGAVPASLILCAHDHVPRSLGLADGRRVVNPGSVGVPAYSEDHPHPHVMENGSPDARYAVLTPRPRGWEVAEHSLPYDWQAAAEAARRNGRSDWADWLSTGRAR